MKAYPLPYITFLDHLKAGKLVGMQCQDCSETIIPPNAACPACGSFNLQEHAFSKKGTLKTFTIIRVGPTGFQVPYVVAMVELAEGPWVVGNLVDIDPQKVDMSQIGKPVSIGCQVIDNQDGEGPDEGVAFTFSLNPKAE